MNKWYRLLICAGTALACLLAVMVMLQVSVVWEQPSPAEAGIATEGRTVTHFTNLWAENYFTVDDQATLTVTDTDEIDPTGSYQPLTSVGTATCTLSIGSAGDFLVLVNVGAQSIIITDQTTIVLAGNYTLVQYDSLFLISDGTRWTEITRSNN